MPAPAPQAFAIPFGANAPALNITKPMPIPSQEGILDGAASFFDGFPPDTMVPAVAGGVAPFGQDMNGVLYAITSHLVAIQAGQPYVWNSAFAASIGGYAVGTLLGSADGTGFWLNTVADNLTNPDSNTAAGWVSTFSYGWASVPLTTGVVTLLPAQFAKSVIFLTGTLTGNVQLVLPPTQQKWLIFNNTTGNFSVTAKTSGGTGVIIPQGASLSVYGDGTNIYALGVLNGVGTFTVTLTGVAGTPTGAAYYQINGKSVTLTLPSVSGTSNAVTCALTGLPAALQPATLGQVVSIPFALNNGAGVYSGVAAAISAGFGGVIGLVLNGSSAGWNASGVKGLGSYVTITYLLN